MMEDDFEGTSDAVGVPLSYGELVDILLALPLLVREKRRRNSLTLRAAGDQLGLQASTVMRIERGEVGGQLTTLISLLRWVGQP